MSLDGDMGKFIEDNFAVTSKSFIKKAVNRYEFTASNILVWVDFMQSKVIEF